MLKDARDAHISEENTSLTFFAEMNNRIFAGLEAARQRSTHVVTREDVSVLGLDVRDDLPLLAGLATLYCPEVDVADMTSCCA